ncbi:hypothetical protein, partial [Aneurinibacillus sp. UBA3580]|uniref:hypothetical protein n=1 Tax=Aneurinibacillus sp. UBA3580 TaxID=1946041 RepID=UPI00257D7224
IPPLSQNGAPSFSQNHAIFTPFFQFVASFKKGNFLIIIVQTKKKRQPYDTIRLYFKEAS